MYVFRKEGGINIVDTKIKSKEKELLYVNYNDCYSKRKCALDCCKLLHTVIFITGAGIISVHLLENEPMSMNCSTSHNSLFNSGRFYLAPLWSSHSTDHLEKSFVAEFG